MNLILAIETSCDETSLALMLKPENIVDFYDSLNSTIVISHVISSQIFIHQDYGGVIPEIGARHHATQIHFLFEYLIQLALKRLHEISEDESVEKVYLVDSIIVKCLQPELNKDKKSTIQEFMKSVQNSDIKSFINQIMVTANPGLPSALRVGKEFAKSLKYYLEKNKQVVELIEINHLKGHVASCFYKI
jgi:tRNA A37 threonylcarbamoyltransferase TsaD